MCTPCACDDTQRTLIHFFLTNLYWVFYEPFLRFQADLTQLRNKGVKRKLQHHIIIRSARSDKGDTQRRSMFFYRFSTVDWGSLIQDFGHVRVKCPSQLMSFTFPTHPPAGPLCYPKNLDMKSFRFVLKFVSFIILTKIQCIIIHQIFKSISK